MKKFKNGIVLSTKYESVQKCFPSAKVLCLSNFDPDREKLSKDRWSVTTLMKRFDDSPRQLKRKLERKNCELNLNKNDSPGPMDAYLGHFNDDEDEPPKKRQRLSPRNPCQQCLANNCNIHSQNCMA